MLNKTFTSSYNSLISVYFWNTYNLSDLYINSMEILCDINCRILNVFYHKQNLSCFKQLFFWNCGHFQIHAATCSDIFGCSIDSNSVQFIQPFIFQFLLWYFPLFDKMSIIIRFLNKFRLLIQKLKKWIIWTKWLLLLTNFRVFLW